MSELERNNYPMIPYVPRSPRRLWRWGLAIFVTLAAIVAGLTTLVGPAPPDLPRAKLPALSAVPNQIDGQIRLAADQQQPLVADEQPQSDVAGTRFTTDQSEPAAFELIPIPQGEFEPATPNFGDLNHGARKRIMGELAAAVSLAERGAFYAARARLIGCLRNVARLRDAQANVDTHSMALAAAFLALDEADDFDDQGTQYQADVLTRNYIAGHQTSILKNSPTPSAVRARNAYYLFARKKLIEAAGAQAISAELLYALGRVEGEMTKTMRAGHQRRAPREVPLFEAAVAVNPNHYIAANELGVALARTGDYRRSLIAFTHSTRTRSTPEALANLEYVSRQLGDHVTASNARQRLAGNRMKPSMTPEVSVVSLEAFNQIPMSGLENPASVSNHGQQQGNPIANAGASRGAFPAPTQRGTPQPREARSSREWFW